MKNDNKSNKNNNKKNTIRGLSKDPRDTGVNYKQKNHNPNRSIDWEAENEYTRKHNKHNNHSHNHQHNHPNDNEENSSPNKANVSNPISQKNFEKIMRELEHILGVTN